MVTTWKTRHIWQDNIKTNIKTYLQEMEWGNMDTVYGQVAVFCECGNEPLLVI
jgi:hypothetical protein